MSYADFIREVAGRVGILPAVFGVPPKTFLQCGSIILCGKAVEPAPIVSKLTFSTVARGVLIP